MTISAVIVGGAVGDSLGMPYETCKWNDPHLLNWDGHTFHSSDFHKLNAGQYTDDTGLTCALATGLLESQIQPPYKYYPEYIAGKYLDWYEGDRFRGAGQTTREALANLQKGIKWYDSGKLDALGNGTAMRVAPLGIFFRNDINTMIKATKLDAIITHNSYEAQMGSLAIAATIAIILNGERNKYHILDSLKVILEPSKVLDRIKMIQNEKLINDTLKPDYNSAIDRNGGNRIIAQLMLGNKYTCVEVVARALYVFLATRSYQEAIELAIRGGGDTDSAASIVGNICGAYYGLEGIPKEYIEQVEDHNYLLELDKKIYVGGERK